MKKNLLSLIFLSLGVPLYAVDAKVQADSILSELKKAVDNQQMYYAGRELRIENLKSELNSRPSPPREKFIFYDRIFNEYKSFQFDSAYTYAVKALGAARQFGCDSLQEVAQYDLLFAYTSSGLFTDAVDVVRAMRRRGVSDYLRADYYHLCSRLYSDMSNYLNKEFRDDYARMCWRYCDSVLMYAAEDSFLHHYIASFQTIGTGDTDAKIAGFDKLLRTVDMNSSQRAVVHSVLGDFYREKGDILRAICHKGEASILDIRSATRETSAKKDLALNLYDLGRVEDASLYIRLALEDANFYDARHRKVEICDVLPAIEQKRYDTIVAQRKRLARYTSTISVLCVLLLCAMVLVYRQMKASRQARKMIESRNRQIEQQNGQLREANSQLTESEKIKDVYIGNTFYLNAVHIEKLERIYRMVNRKVAAKQYDDLRTIFNESDLQKEREQIYASFDAGVLRLFPSFIRQYNELFDPSERTAEDDSESLTTEMRIFALIRLGITDTDRIAKFLNYSVNTINTYKTKTKNRSRIPNMQFEQRIMAIRSGV